MTSHLTIFFCLQHSNDHFKSVIGRVKYILTMILQPSQNTHTHIYKQRHIQTCIQRKRVAQSQNIITHERQTERVSYQRLQREERSPGGFRMSQRHVTTLLLPFRAGVGVGDEGRLFGGSDRGCLRVTCRKK